MKQKRFTIYNRDYNTSKIVELEFFTEENGFADDDVEDISSLEIAESLILGIDDVIITRIWKD